METGYLIEEGGIISRLADGAIAFGTGAEYVAVIAGSSNDEVAPATAAAATTLGFTKKPFYGTIEDGDILPVITTGIIKVPVTGTIAIGEDLEISSATALRTLAAGSTVARALQAATNELAWVQIKM